MTINIKFNSHPKITIKSMPLVQINKNENIELKMEFVPKEAYKSIISNKDI